MILEAKRAPGLSHQTSKRSMLKYWYNHDSGKLHNVQSTRLRNDHGAPEYLEDPHHIDFAMAHPDRLNLDSDQMRDVEIHHDPDTPTLPPNSSLRNNTRVTVFPHAKSMEMHYGDGSRMSLGHGQDILRKMEIPMSWDVHHSIDVPTAPGPGNPNGNSRQRVIRSTAVDTLHAKQFRDLDWRTSHEEDFTVPAELFESSLNEDDLAHVVDKYVNHYGVKRTHASVVSGDYDNKSHSLPLRDVLHHPVYVKGQCYDVSHDFARWGKANYPEHKYRVIHGEGPTLTGEHGEPEFNEHWAVAVNNKHVVDLTRRQFEPDAPVQSIHTIGQWRAKHPAMEECLTEDAPRYKDFDPVKHAADVRIYRQMVGLKKSNELEKKLGCHKPLAQVSKDGFTHFVSGRVSDIPDISVPPKGTHFIRNDSTGQVVKAGYWMDWPEDHWGISEHDYRQKPDHERAAMEAHEQTHVRSAKRNWDFQRQFKQFRIGIDNVHVGGQSSPVDERSQGLASGRSDASEVVPEGCDPAIQALLHECDLVLGEFASHQRDLPESLDEAGKFPPMGSTREAEHQRNYGTSKKFPDVGNHSGFVMKDGSHAFVQKESGMLIGVHNFVAAKQGYKPSKTGTFSRGGKVYPEIQDSENAAIMDGNVRYRHHESSDDKRFKGITHIEFDGLHPDAELKPETGHGPKFDLGTHQVRQALRHLAKHYPDAQTFGGYRMTGGLAGAKDNYQVFHRKHMFREDLEEGRMHGMFGFVGPDGHDHFAMPYDDTHHDIAKRLGMSDEHDAIKRGYIRYYHNHDDSGVEYEPSPVAHRRAARIVQNIDNPVRVDLRKNYNTSLLFSRDFPSGRVAARHLNSMTETCLLSELEALSRMMESFDASDLESLYGHDFSHPAGSSHPLHQVLSKHGWEHDSTYSSTGDESRYVKNGQKMFVTNWVGKQTHDEDPLGHHHDMTGFKPDIRDAIGHLKYRKETLPAPHWIHQGGGHGLGALDLDSYLTHIRGPRRNERLHGEEVLTNGGWKLAATVGPQHIYYTHPDHVGHTIGLHHESDGTMVTHKTPNQEWQPFNVQGLSGHLAGSKTGVWDAVEES